MVWVLIYKIWLIEMICEHIAAELEDIVGVSTEITVVSDPRNFTRLSELSDNNVIVSNLEHLVSLPLRIRRIQYEPRIGKDLDHTEFELDNCINEVLRSAMEIIESRMGEIRSLKWSRETYMQINRIVAGSGPRGILFGPDAITKIVHRDDLNEIVESLEFLFDDGYKPIATRINKHGVQPTYFEGFEAKVNGKTAPVYSDLLSNLQELCVATDVVDSDRFSHLFVWSDSPLDTFQPSLVGRVLNDCIFRHSSTAQHSAKVLLFCSFPPPSGREYQTRFSAKEKLALSRAFGNGKLYLAPGKNTDIFTNPINKANRPESIFNSVEYVEDTASRMEQLKVDEHRIAIDLQYVAHESTIDLVQNSAFVLVADCWTGTWNESKEIDGEQVMSK